MSITLKSPISRMGGKYYLTGWLSQYIPEHTVYVEPFCGAGHLLFSKEPSQVEVINDADSRLIAFFELLKDDTKRSKLIQTLDNMPYSRRLWQEIRSRWNQGNISQNEIERAAWWYYLNRTTFSGDQKRGGFAIPSTTGRNPAQSYYNAIDGLEHIAKRLRGVTVECLNYANCIKRYDAEGTFFYADPPYVNTEDYYGKDCFTLQDHYKLAELLHGIKGHVMVTHYQNSLYDDLYKGWHRYEYQSFKGSHKSTGETKPKTQECLFTNYEAAQRSLF